MEAEDKEYKGLTKMICYVCGSENLTQEKCKVSCRDCHALIENCSGD